MELHKRTKDLREFIGKYESNNNYDIVWGGIKPKDYPPGPLTGMTIGQVLAWQDSIDPFYMSEAAGYYQIMEDTLRDIYHSAGFTTASMFGEYTQDMLAIHLMQRRGLDRYLKGEITAEKFCNNLAREWASLPLVSGDRKGYSYYAGDGLNKAHADPDDFLAVVTAMVNGEQPNTTDWEAHYVALYTELLGLVEKYKL